MLDRNQRAEEGQHEQDWDQPPFLVVAEEHDEFSEQAGLGLAGAPLEIAARAGRLFQGIVRQCKTFR